MQVLRAVIGGILLFLGRELNFLFAAAMAALLGLRLTPLLPLSWPDWGQYAFMAGLAIVAAVLVIVRERAGYFITGFLVGSYFLVEYYEPGVLTLPVLPFLVGGVIGAVMIGLFTEWALMLVSCLVGAYFVTGMFTLSPTAEILIGSGLFIVGALTQVVLRQMQGSDEEI
jgi:hypothetical protein